MPFIPHTEKDIREMLAVIGIASIDQLFDEIPKELLVKKLEGIPSGLNEMEVSRFMAGRAAQDGNSLCFLGAGAYEHHIPAVVWDIVSRGEFMTAYTPYQAEASQGGLQLLYEYQTMMASLTGMDVSNASLYDGASSLAEAVLMAIRSNRKCKTKRVLIPKTVHPLYIDTVKSIVSKQDVIVDEVPYDEKNGVVDVKALDKLAKSEFAALVIPWPNFFGILENIDVLTDWAHAHDALVIAVVNPLALGVLKAPGKWGQLGADIACGEAQPLGIPLSAGGPYLGILCCKEAYVRQMPGRVVGKTYDVNGKPGYTLTLQAREQHIRRSKATSNICSNEGLMAAAATIHMSLMGPRGLQEIAAISHQRTRELVEKVTQIKGVSLRFKSPYFHEVVLTLPQKADKVIDKMADARIEAGLALGRFYATEENDILVCCTETKTEEDINHYVECLKAALCK